MSNEVRKPREFYIQLPSGSFKTYEIVRRFISTKKFEPIGLEAEIIHCKEILPGDDSLRVNMIYWGELTAAIMMDDLDKAAYWADLIERESKGE